MNIDNANKLPKRLSDWIRLSANDMLKTYCEVKVQNVKCRIDMYDYNELRVDNSDTVYCHVCLAGSLLLQNSILKPGESVDIIRMRHDSIYKKIDAIDDIRHFWITYAISSFYFANRHYIEQRIDETMFIAAENIRNKYHHTPELDNDLSNIFEFYISLLELSCDIEVFENKFKEELGL